MVFIAVPHRGSEMANSAIGRIGASLVELPQSLVQRGEGVIGNLMRHGWLQPDNSKIQTGIDNLDPNNRTLQLLETIPFRPGVPYHSVIGNRKEAGIPGGSDGIVPYSSSHLDGAVSELVVKSDHSAQQNPLAIREIRRILLEHLRQYPGHPGCHAGTARRARGGSGGTCELNRFSSSSIAISCVHSA